METQNIKHLDLHVAEWLVKSMPVKRRHLVVVYVNDLRLVFGEDDRFCEFARGHYLLDCVVKFSPDRTGLFVTVNQKALER